MFCCQVLSCKGILLEPLNVFLQTEIVLVDQIGMRLSHIAKCHGSVEMPVTVDFPSGYR